MLANFRYLISGIVAHYLEAWKNEISLQSETNVLFQYDEVCWWYARILFPWKGQSNEKPLGTTHGSMLVYGYPYMGVVWMGVGRSGCSWAARRKSLVLSRKMYSVSLDEDWDDTVLSGRGVCFVLSIDFSSVLFSSLTDEWLRTSLALRYFALRFLNQTCSKKIQLALRNLSYC